MATELLPPSFWFRLALPCRRVETMPREAAGGRLLDLPAACRLPAPARWEGREPFAELRAAWNPRGLGLAVEVRGKRGRPSTAPAEPDFRDSVHLWIDTRDTRDIHRASRYCHRFVAYPVPGRGGPAACELQQRPIPRAAAEAPRGRIEEIRRAAEFHDRLWRLELFIPAAILHGFDPETNRRLGLMVQVIEPGQGEQFLGVGREFPIESDPSLWQTLELRDESA